MAEAVLRGARMVDDVESRACHAAEATVEDLLAADALIVGTPENFGYMAGMIKDFFDRVYYPSEGKVEGRPYTVFVCAGNDGSGAMRHIDRIATGLHLNKVLPGLVVRGGAQAVDAAALSACEELGSTLAAGLSIGMY